MIVFVDYEHADGRDGDLGRQLLAARTWITYRLEDLSGRHCMLVRYDRITPELLDHVDARAIFISGNATDPEHYDPEATRALVGIIRSTELPMFGSAAASSSSPRHWVCRWYRSLPRPGRRRIPTSGSLPRTTVGLSSSAITPSISITTTRPIRPVVRHAHGLHVPDPPDGFEVIATNDITPVQLAVHDERRIVGTQFHPEYWTDEHPGGRTMIANFLRWNRLAD